MIAAMSVMPKMIGLQVTRRLDLDHRRLRQAAAGRRHRARGAETGRRRKAGRERGQARNPRWPGDRAGRDRAALCRSGRGCAALSPPRLGGAAPPRVAVEIPRPRDAAPPPRPPRGSTWWRKVTGTATFAPPDVAAARHAVCHGADDPRGWAAKCCATDGRCRRGDCRGVGPGDSTSAPASRSWPSTPHLACHAGGRRGRHRVGPSAPYPIRRPRCLEIIRAALDDPPNSTPARCR